jgi:hypothetical protein
MEQNILSHLLGLQERHDIEHMAAELSFEDARDLLQHIAESPKQYEEKIQPLLTGLPDSIYAKLWPTSLLKPFAKNESLQHKMGLLIGKIKKNFIENQQKIEILAQRIASFPLSPILPDALSALQIDIQDAFEENAAQIDLLSAMTEISWLTERSDLIAELSALKSALIHLSYHLGLLPEFLLKKLEETLGILDEASPQEALRSLGFTYPEDFEPLFAALKIDPEMNRLEIEFKKRGLASVKDFKTHHIFTKELLISHLNKIN